MKNTVFQSVDNLIKDILHVHVVGCNWKLVIPYGQRRMLGAIAEQYVSDLFF